MAMITVIVPLVIFVMAHMLVAEDYYSSQSGIILLFFGWVTGAQLIFSTYHMHAQNMWRLMMLSIISLVVVVLGYVFISHAFDLFLYPSEAFRNQLYTAATIDLISYEALLTAIVLFVVSSWLFTYYCEQNVVGRKQAKRMWLNFYALISREFYVMDIYTRLTRTILSISGRLNVWLRWL